ncbi:survival motor neuron protein 1 isoform X2 [Macrobrachium rosenbergii]|uniref:survival motor neuron protein 1 isoform X2 n=1 Tax=Macrobrachium rosenbergii TaxID=79674 RepID=UPI0034D6341B
METSETKEESGIAGFREGEVLFDVNRKDDLTHDEIWDDTILIQQYDEASARVRKMINNRLGTTESEVSEVNTASDRDNKNSKKKRRKARKKAQMSDLCSSVQESDMQSDTDGERSSKMKTPRPPGMPQHRMPPPSFFGSGAQFNPPPYLPDLPPPPALAMDVSDDPRTSEALHTMLMSWYMTGYHTGYYQGLKQAESLKQRKKHK